jgi:hypothetical protein
MSMIGNFFAIEEAKAKELMNNPDAIEDFIYSEESPIDESDDFLDIDKSWHGIHFLLTGDVWEGEPPARDVILGGETLGEDVGYGPARFLSVEEVQKVHSYLSKLESNILKKNYKPEELEKNEIYPNGWGDEDYDYLAGYFDELKNFYKKASNENKMVIQYLN